MQSPEPFRLFTRRLDALGLRYMVTGSVAAIYYGEPRLTNDVDLVVFLAREDAARIEAAFPPAEYYCPPREVLEIEAAREQRGHFILIHHETGFKADVYPMGRDELHAWALARARVADLEGEPVCFAPPEYVIVRKLEFLREGNSSKHLRDVARMLATLGDELDREALLGWVVRRGLLAEWERVENA